MKKGSTETPPSDRRWLGRHGWAWPEARNEWLSSNGSTDAPKDVPKLQAMTSRYLCLGLVPFLDEDSGVQAEALESVRKSMGAAAGRVLLAL